MKNFLFYLSISIFLLSSFASAEIFHSLKKSKVNVRYGPSFDSPVKYIYKKINFPIKQIDVKENWRRIIDFKNNSGWIHWSQLKRINSIIVLEDKILFTKPSKFSKPIAKIQKGKLLILNKCEKHWCKIKSGKLKGWIKTDNVWGIVK